VLARNFGIFDLTFPVRQSKTQLGKEEFTINASRWQALHLSPGFFAEPLGHTAMMPSFNWSIYVPNALIPDYAHSTGFLSNDARDESCVLPRFNPSVPHAMSACPDRCQQAVPLY
jgi:hypothetical protein